MFCILGWCHVQDFLRITNSNDHKRVLHRIWGNRNWKKRNVFILLYIYIVIYLYCYFGAVLWSCTCWYCIAGIPLLSRFLRFLVLTHNRGERNHSYKLWIPSCKESTNNANQPLTQNFKPKNFRAMPINQTEH